jgi:acetylornithine deacetylase/succinyl-diaminopimelate desuccinylase-like protein
MGHIEADALRDEAVALLQELIRVDTSNPPGNETAAAELLRDYLVRHGIECELVARVPGRANLVARLKGSGGGPSLALTGHTDVVPADPRDWQRPPFAAELDGDGYLWGRGAVDMKNHTATNAVALATLAREGFRPRGDLVLIAQADEEDGTEAVGMQWLVQARPDLRVDYAVDEGGGERIPLADGGVAVTVGVAEKACLPVLVTALGEAGHASTPYLAANAVPRLATLIGRIAAHRPRRTLLPVVRRMLEQLGADVDGDLDAAVAHVAARSPQLAEDLPALLAMTFAPTRLQGSAARNVMPARATVDVDARLLPGQTRADLERELRAALGDDLPYELDFPEPLSGGTISGVDSPLYDACASFLAEHDPEAVLLPSVSTGFVDSYFMRSGWGTECIGFWPTRTTPLEVMQAGVHNRDERIHVDDVGYAARFLLHAARTVVG